MHPSLQHFFAHLSVAPRVPRPENEPWTQLIQRISTSGQIAQLDESTYWYFLEVLPPHYQDSGLYAFAEGAEPFRLFWRDRNGRFWARQLTWDETSVFCNLAEISLPR